MAGKGDGGGGGGGRPGASADVGAQLRQVLMGTASDAVAVVEASAVDEENPTQDAGNDDVEEDEEDEEVTTAEFELELTDAQTWAMNFYECAAEGDLECLEEILDSGKVGVDDVDVDGFTALMIAAAEGHRAIVRALLARGADTSVRTHELRSTALHFAAKHGDAEIVEAICAKSDSVDYWNANEDTPLIWACIEGRVDAARVLLAHGANMTAVNHYGAPALLCAVMIGENPDEDDSDRHRAEILRLLLEKDGSLVNFQDREGSTAMHLAASCGYLECVKTLLSFGADITLRNAIGQTPLEEAEISDLRGSSECVAHLRVIWRQLEEEASARMIAMLEMEESAAVTTEGARSGSKKSKKKHKHKSGKRKTTATAKAQTAANDGGSNTATIAAPTEADGSVAEANSDAHETSVDDPDKGVDDTSAEVRASIGINSDEEGDNDADIDSGDNSTNKPHSDDEKAGASDINHDLSAPDQTPGVEATQGAWTTVGRKHRGGSVSAGGSVEPKVVASTRNSHHKSSPKKGNAARVLHSPSKRQAHVPATDKSVVATTHPTPATDELSRRDAPARASRFQAATKATAVTSVSDTATPVGFAPKTAPAATTSSGSSGYAQGVLGASSVWRASELSMAFGGVFRMQPPPQLLPPSLLSGPSSSLHVPLITNGIPSASRFAWKHGHLHHHYPSHYYYYHHHQQSSRIGAQGFAREATTRWISKLELGNAAVSDSLALLACGYCGELVDDNLQCSGDANATASSAASDGSAHNVCTQLYCSSCVARVAAGAEHFTCVKCRRRVSRALMRRNEFAQHQAASLALSINHSGTAADAGPSASGSNRSVMSPDGLQRVLFATVPRAEAVDLRVCDLIPGASDLSTLSNGQLEVLDAAHAAARQAIVDQQIANARALERVQLLEWLKLHRVALPSQSLTPALFPMAASPLASSMALGTPATDVTSSTPSSMHTADPWRA